MDTAALPAPPETLAIDFANTRYWRGLSMPTETLGGVLDLLDWVGTTGQLPEATLAALRDGWLHDPNDGERALAQALAWREAIYRGLSAASAGVGPEPVDLACLNAALSKAPVRQRLCQTAAGLRWDVGHLPLHPASLLAPVLWSAGDLLLGPKLPRVRQCANPACRFLFLDDSRTGSRRWCSMSACGNRAKAHRHYLRTKAGNSS